MKKKRRSLLIAIWILYLVVLFESSARLAFSIPKMSQRLWAENDLSWRRAWISRRKAIGTDIYYKFDIYDPSKGWISKPNLRDMKVFDNKVLNTNSKGFRGKNEYSYSKEPDKVRILVLGDSFTFGDEVSDNETYSYHLQEMTPNAEVINLGVHGYGHDQMLILLKEEGIKYKPDIIILGFLFIDMSRNLLEFRDYAKPKFILDNNELKLTGTPVPTLEETARLDWARPRIIDMGSFIIHKLKQSSGLYSKEEESITTAILTEIIAVADSIHAKPIFVYLPYGDEIFNPYSLTSGEDYLFTMCQKNDKVTCFSTRPYFAEKIAQGVSFKKEGHWGTAGHLAAAEAIKRHLDDERCLLRDKASVVKPNSKEP